MKIKLVIWLAASLAISVLFFGELWAKLPGWLSPDGLQQHGIFHWGVLGLCGLWLWLKRCEIRSRMSAGGWSLTFTLIGVAAVILAISLPRSDDFLVLLMLLGWLGIFAVIFGRASIVPFTLLAIYGFSLAFPLLMTTWIGKPSMSITTNTVITVARVVGLPVTSTGQTLQIAGLNGQTTAATITPDCAGYTTIGVFISLFTLMMLDIPLPLRKAWYIFLIGLAGTWLQNIVRISASLTAAYFWGPGALDTTHNYISYAIFPLWYALFAYLYLRQTHRQQPKQDAKKESRFRWPQKRDLVA
ncbi:MAG: exosortase/archaeosortase family protein [Dehalococcoidales bacterium]|nr:exosortase/archaeosortase family protein [Dehalococcoidales bacterium]